MLREQIEKVSSEKSYKDAVEILSEEFYYDLDTDSPFEPERLKEFNWCDGACKICILFSNFVLKTAYVGVVDSKKMKFTSYEDFGLDGNCLKNAKTEHLIYQAAVEEGLGRFFVETIQVAENVFAQEKVDSEVWQVGLIEISKEVHQFCDNRYIPFDLRVVQMLLNSGETVGDIFEFIDFLDRFGVDDLHNGNIGILNGKVKLFDFAGFCSESTDKAEQWESNRNNKKEVCV